MTTKKEMLRIELTPKDFDTAQKLMAEAQEFGGDVSNLKLAITFPPDREIERWAHSVFSTSPPPNIEVVRTICRRAVLMAHGADAEEANLVQVFYKAKMEHFGFNAGQIGTICLWRDRENGVIAKGPRWCFQDTPLFNQLMALRPTNRSWDTILFWDLGAPELFFKKESRVNAKAAIFLFSDELEKLKTEGQVLVRNHHDLMEETFEGFLLTKRPDYGWLTVYRVKARLLD